MQGSRGLLAVVVAVIALLALVPAAGVDAATSSASAALPAAATAPGYDISWPQCGGPYPVNPAFGIVGVNKGIVFSPNPCLASEVTWAGGTSAALYANTGNPGPALSTHWPTGQTSPQVCSAANPDTAACAYDYGYNAASDSYADAVSAFTALGLSGTPAGSAWWLDVETSNSWRSDVTLNVAALSGAVYYLGSVAHIASLGFYSTSYQWGVITGGTTTFSAYPSWVAGAADAAGARANCAGPGFTGGGITLAQYPSGGFDADLRCSRGATYHTLAPARILDTRYGTGLSGVFHSNLPRQFAVTGHGGVPTGAIALTGNLTVSGQSSRGYVSLTTTSQPTPGTSTLNFPLADTRANGVTVPLTGSGTLWATFVGTSAGATTQLIFDVTGYFMPDASGATYVSVGPNRILDSRTSQGLATLHNGVAQSVQVTGLGQVPANALAITGNLTVTGQTAAGYFALTPVATTNPTTSTLNFPLRDDRANGVTVPLGIGGRLSVTYVARAGATAQVVFDVTGYFVP